MDWCTKVTGSKNTTRGNGFESGHTHLAMHVLPGYVCSVM